MISIRLTLKIKEILLKSKKLFKYINEHNKRTRLTIKIFIVNLKITSKYIYYKYPEFMAAISILSIRYIMCTNLFICNPGNIQLIEKEVMLPAMITVEEFFNNKLKVNKLVGHILGDGFISNNKRENENSSFAYSQTILRMNYFLKVQEFIQPLLTVDKLPALKGLEIHGKTGHIYPGINTTTKSLKQLTELRNLFYINNEKVIPKNINDYMSPELIESLYFDDGFIENRFGLMRKKPTYAFCVENFKVEDIERLQNSMNDILNIKTSLFPRNNSFRLKVLNPDVLHDILLNSEYSSVMTDKIYLQKIKNIKTIIEGLQILKEQGIVLTEPSFQVGLDGVIYHKELILKKIDKMKSLDLLLTKDYKLLLKELDKANLAIEIMKEKVNLYGPYAKVIKKI
uniref:Endonuclease 2 n=1 Tax=Heterostelium pallidum TaxID=13642 RepID=B2XX30_HETPA|nr:endonuclease 2 [Heterostelium pallidum]